MQPHASGRHEPWGVTRCGGQAPGRRVWGNTRGKQGGANQVDTASEIVLRLADPSARAEVLTADALLAIVTVAYDLDPALVDDQATATFDRFDLAVPLSTRAAATAQFRRTGEPVPWEVSASWDTGAVPPPAADAVWSGGIVVRTATVNDTIVAVAATQSSPDEEVALTATVAMSPPDQDPAPAPLALPVVVAFLAADTTTAPRELLRATAAAHLAANRYTVTAVPAGGPVRRVERLVCWVVPAAIFDDPGWPGADSDSTPERQRADRLAAARSWLAGQGVALITVTEPT